MDQFRQKQIVDQMILAYDEDVNNLQERRRCVEKDPQHAYVGYPIGWICFYAFRFIRSYPDHEGPFY